MNLSILIQHVTLLDNGITFLSPSPQIIARAGSIYPLAGYLLNYPFQCSSLIALFSI
jgi:hypothetical protein